MRKKIVAGNWKMNKTPKEAIALCELLKDKVNTKEVEVIFFVPAVDLHVAIECLKDTDISVGAQNMFYEENGAFTGEISPKMLVEMGVSHVLIGHSERREYFGETNETVNKKVKKALEHGLKPILCCGETLEQRELGITMEWIGMQIKAGLFEISEEDMKKIVVAYEPIWAIGTGKTASTAQAQEVCCGIRNILCSLYNKEIADGIQIQYGGSVSGTNAAELFAMADIDGGLVGGASLKEEFSQIVNYKNS